VSFIRLNFPSAAHRNFTSSDNTTIRFVTDNAGP
jgi:hypothetical protein